MMTRDFAERTRTRFAETRAVIARLREASKEAIRQVAKIDKQHAADRGRIYDRLGRLVDDVVDKLPEEASETDVESAHAIQEQINDLSADVDEISLAGSTIEDLGGMLGDAIDEIYTHLKAAESQLTKVDRLGAKLGI